PKASSVWGVRGTADVKLGRHRLLLDLSPGTVLRHTPRERKRAASAEARSGRLVADRPSVHGPSLGASKTRLACCNLEHVLDIDGTRNHRETDQLPAQTG